MIVFGKTANKPNYLFKQFPSYFKENDTYVPNAVTDHTTEGFLERYLGIFCEELDANVSPYIDDVLSITDASALHGLSINNPNDFLNLISDLFGNPPDVSISTVYSGPTQDNYIKLIRYIRHILQTKGTRKSLEYYLALYGYEIDTLTESSTGTAHYDETPTPLKYDDGLQYDKGFIFYSGFDLIISPLPGITFSPAPTTDWLDNYLKPAIQKFIAPIWAQLGSLTYVP